MADDFIGGLGSVGGSQVGGANTNTTADQLRNQVLSQLVTALQAALPQANSNVTTTVSAGTHAVPANAVGFLTITLNGTAYKLALFGT